MYAKTACDSIHSEKTRVRPARTDAEHDVPRTSRAIPHVLGVLAVDVNPGVDATTGEMYTQIRATSRRPVAGRSRLVARVEVFADHGLGYPRW